MTTVCRYLLSEQIHNYIIEFLINKCSITTKYELVCSCSILAINHRIGFSTLFNFLTVENYFNFYLRLTFVEISWKQQFNIVVMTTTCFLVRHVIYTSRSLVKFSECFSQLVSFCRRADFILSIPHDLVM